MDGGTSYGWHWCGPCQCVPHDVSPGRMGSEGVLGQQTSSVSPAWQFCLGGPCSCCGGMLQTLLYVDTLLARLGEVSPQLRAALGQSWQSCFAQLPLANTCPALSSPLLLFSARLLGGTQVFQGHLEVLPRVAGERKGSLVLTETFLCPFPVHSRPEGAEEDQVTQVPSIKLLLKELSCGMAMP